MAFHDLDSYLLDLRAWASSFVLLCLSSLNCKVRVKEGFESKLARLFILQILQSFKSQRDVLVPKNVKTFWANRKVAKYDGNIMK